jgi:2-phosphosulfolactate phosphatase
MQKTVIIDYDPRCGDSWPRTGVVVVDVIRATTTAVTGVALGRRCLPVASLAAARATRRFLPNPLLVGEVGGARPPGFDLNNSPAALSEREDVSRPMVLLSSSGTRLLERLRRCHSVYVGCFRNYRAVADHVAARHSRVALLGAGSHGEFREEDQMCCAWIAERLVAAGYAPETAETANWIAKWSGVPMSAFLCSRSVEYLRASDQEQDLDFILRHIDDLDLTFSLRGGEIVISGSQGSAN